MWAIVPEIRAPDFVAVFVTITPMSAGSGAFGGFELLPGAELQAAPHEVPAVSAKPLKLAGAPPASGLFFSHCAPQNRTLVPDDMVSAPLPFRGPTTNAPRDGNEN